MQVQEMCPLCGEGHVTSHCEEVEQSYAGHRSMVPMHFRSCDHCGSDFAGAEESQLNKRAMVGFRKRVDELLSGSQIRKIREKYKISQAQAAKLFGGGPVAFSKYEHDDVAQSAAMDNLLRLVEANESAFWTLVSQKGMRGEFVRTSTQASRSSEGHYVVSPTEASAKNAIYDPKAFRTIPAPRAKTGGV
ncbi:MAG: type II toxin-antitoxin system MqsA family antitoxin [Sphaerotilus sulfidivorans]|uniref:type II toxin-antitoxin system MqsA family antitoxin n=1 Tax=Sphaerotilus sulfidivorans TaxID=639200 RepID=UPI003F2B9732